MTYSDQTKTETVALARVVGSEAAATQTGVARRTIDRWVRDVVVPEVDTEAFSDRLHDLLRLALDRLEAALHDPKARLIDLVRATEALNTARRLEIGAATKRSETNVTIDIDAQIRSLAVELAIPEDAVRGEYDRIASAIQTGDWDAYRAGAPAVAPVTPIPEPLVDPRQRAHDDAMAAILQSARERAREG